MIMRKFLLVLSIFLPSVLKKIVYSQIMGWKIESGVKIGYSYIDSTSVTLGKDTKIGHFNIIRDLNHLEIGKSAYIGNFNQFFGARQCPGFASALIIGHSGYVMSHHFIDVGGTILIGDHVVVGGRSTQIWGHSLLYDSGQQEFKALDVTIGKHSYIGANSTLVGCRIPAQTVVGAGSVVTKKFEDQTTPVLIAGNPAIIKKYYEDQNSQESKESIS
jgi:acetyltransferase-like isoleucine patch superfamily enzyme